MIVSDIGGDPAGRDRSQSTGIVISVRLRASGPRDRSQLVAVVVVRVNVHETAVAVSSHPIVALSHVLWRFSTFDT